MGPPNTETEQKIVKDASETVSVKDAEAANEPQASAGAEEPLPREPDRVAQIASLPGISTTSSKSPSSRASSQYSRLSSASISIISEVSGAASTGPKLGLQIIY